VFIGSSSPAEGRARNGPTSRGGVFQLLAFHVVAVLLTAIGHIIAAGALALRVAAAAARAIAIRALLLLLVVFFLLAARLLARTVS